jgi:FkbM family methyltransferase
MDGKIAEKGIPKAVLLEKLSKAQRYANASKAFRFMNDPFRYSSAMWWQYIAFPFFKSEKEFRIRTFWDSPFTVRLPAGTDIYLSGAKTHPSELSLARYLIKHLSKGSCFWDIGSHFGYFSALAAKICGPEGSVLSVEASPWAFEALGKNVSDIPGVQILQKAVSNAEGWINFYEFPSRYSEYNSIRIDQYKDESWLQSCPPKIHKVPTVSIDQMILAADRIPDIIKIDVEGAEHWVFQGAGELLKSNRPVKLIMEYLPDNPHKQALKITQEAGWKIYTLDEKGEATLMTTTADEYLESVDLQSDNFLLQKF